MSIEAQESVFSWNIVGRVISRDASMESYEKLIVVRGLLNGYCKLVLCDPKLENSRYSR